MAFFQHNGRFTTQCNVAAFFGGHQSSEIRFWLLEDFSQAHQNITEANRAGANALPPTTLS
jgi:hypothetical protein